MSRHPLGHVQSNFRVRISRKRVDEIVRIGKWKRKAREFMKKEKVTFT